MNYFSVSQVLDRDQFAWLTPTMGDIDPTCKAASDQLINQAIHWTQHMDSSYPSLLYMYDSDGKFPQEGFLSDTREIPVDVCSLLSKYDIDCRNEV